jgi:hypothetical protein
LQGQVADVGQVLGRELAGDDAQVGRGRLGGVAMGVELGIHRDGLAAQPLAAGLGHGRRLSEQRQLRDDD